jgi:hypothetical protein
LGEWGAQVKYNRTKSGASFPGIYEGIQRAITLPDLLDMKPPATPGKYLMVAQDGKSFVLGDGGGILPDDRTKLDSIVIDGDGSSVLANNGEYVVIIAEGSEI